MKRGRHREGKREIKILREWTRKQQSVEGLKVKKTKRESIREREGERVKTNLTVM